jgi:hypothetical protein
MNQKLCYAQARRFARYRQIGWRLTFAEWLSIWGPHWQRKLTEDLVLARHGDLGDYALGNVAVKTRRENNLEAIRLRYLGDIILGVPKFTAGGRL